MTHRRGFLEGSEGDWRGHESSTREVAQGSIVQGSQQLRKPSGYSKERAGWKVLDSGWQYTEQPLRHPVGTRLRK